jgi:hypothetical protein
MTDDKMPTSARWVADFIQRVGFPVVVALAAIALLYMQMTEMKSAYLENSDKVVAAVNKNTEAITALRHFLTKKYD